MINIIKKDTFLYIVHRLTKVKEVPFKMVILLQRAGLIQVKSHDILLDYANQTKIVDY